MSQDNKFGMLRKLLRALGLSQQAADNVVDYIVDMLAGERAKEAGPIFPYRQRDNFLSPAELHFLKVLRVVVGQQAVICTKVNLNDLFYVHDRDPSTFRIYTNKIDRKHVDFLLCNGETMKPLVAIELDDRSHQRKDRQERDAFVNEVFAASNLPLLHMPVKRIYPLDEIVAQLAPYVQASTELQDMPEPMLVEEPDPVEIADPVCPKCGSPMMLRTAKRGENAGNQFWGCSAYPKCRTIMSVEDIGMLDGEVSRDVH